MRREQPHASARHLSRLNSRDKTINRFPEPSLPTRFLPPTLFGADTASVDFSEQIRMSAFKLVKGGRHPPSQFGVSDTEINTWEQRQTITGRRAIGSA
jgi:hypothetical protein